MGLKKIRFVGEHPRLGHAIKEHYWYCLDEKVVASIQFKEDLAQLSLGIYRWEVAFADEEAESFTDECQIESLEAGEQEVVGRFGEIAESIEVLYPDKQIH